jgi:hypothetical protein
MNALWNHFVFPVISTAKRAFIFNLSGTGSLRFDPGKLSSAQGAPP